MLIYSSVCFSQGITKSGQPFVMASPLEYKSDVEQFINDSLSIFIQEGICKKNKLIIIQKYVPVVMKPVLLVSISKKSNLTVHGNILYNFSYRSYLDTPFAQKDLIQNLIQTNLRVLIKDKYPLKIIISSRNSNSPFFQNTTDVQVEYQKHQLLDYLKDDLKEKAVGMVDVQSVIHAQEIYNSHVASVKKLESWINSPARTQEIIEEKERNLNGKNIHLPSIQKPYLKTDKLLGLGGGRKEFFNNYWESLIQTKIDSSKEVKNRAKFSENISPKKDSSVINNFNDKKQQLSKLSRQLKEDEEKLKQDIKAIQDSIKRIKQEISSITSSAKLYSFMERNGISKDSLSRIQKIMLSIDQVGIGRSFIDYSELTVKNISLTGINIEANPGKFYFAAAAGKVNYRFRDFILKNNDTSPKQSLYLLRAGIGKKDKNNFILTFYSGKKLLLNYTSNFSSSLSQKILGFSAETRIAINANNYLIAEVAKSSFYNSAFQLQTSELIKNAMDLKEHSNEAYSIKLFSQNPRTDTKITAYYKKMGKNFQSFNLYPVNVNEASWMVRTSQYFWKRKLSVDAAIRKNDFLSSIAIPSDFNTKTIFLSLQASLRIRKFPFVSVGYYPTSQLSVLNNNTLIESQYNTLNAVISYSYLARKTSMNTTSVFTRFFNASTDTGFIYYNASSYSLNHSIFLSSFSLQSGLSIIKEKNLNLFTLEQSVAYQINNNFSLTGGLKWNRLNKKQNFYGGTAAMKVYIKRIGTIQLNYEKSFLPGYNRTLKAVDIGRIGFYRDF